MIDCNTLYGCSEGYWTKGWKQIQTDRYAALEANRPYLADKDETRCLRETDNGLTDIMQIGSYQVHREEDDEETMIGFLATYGPIVVAVLVDDTLYWYGSGVIEECKGGRVEVNHLVTLVGFDETTLLLKNSWGNEWGEKGYFKLGRGCGSSGYSYWASYLSVVSMVDEVDTPYDEQVDVYGTDDGFFVVEEVDGMDFILKNMSNVGIKVGDVITLDFLDTEEAVNNFKFELSYIDEQGNQDRVFVLRYYHNKRKARRSQIAQKTSKEGEGTIEAVYRKAQLTPGAIIDIMVTDAGFSVNFNEKDLPLYPHILPLESINTWQLESLKTSRMFANVTLVRREGHLHNFGETQLSECVDLDSYCEDYVLDSDTDACAADSTAEWMKSYCPKSCGLCKKLDS